MRAGGAPIRPSSLPGDAAARSFRRRGPSDRRLPSPHRPRARSYDHFVELYNTKLLASDNYVLKRQSLQLLSEFLLERENFKIMIKYIADPQNLKAIMLVLRSKQANIQVEAFHVFKIFVANPEKPPKIAEILSANKQKLLAFLQAFLNEKDDETFAAEKGMLIDALQRLDEPAAAEPAT